MIKLPLTQMMQAALVRNAAYTTFEHCPKGFRTHPANASLTWHALEALEDSCIVKLFECFKKYKAHTPASVVEKHERFMGHRNIVGHPFHLKEKDWDRPSMRRFEAEGRRYENRVPLVWELHQALNAELAKEGANPLPDFVVTAEMAQQVRQIHLASMRPINFASIPDDAKLVELLTLRRDMMLQACRDRAEGKPQPQRPETELEKLWAAYERGEKIHWPADDD